MLDNRGRSSGAARKPRRQRIRAVSSQTLYASEKLGEAMHVLLTRAGDCRQRLYAAAEPLAAVSLGHLPRPLKGEYNAIWKALTRFKPKGRWAKHSSPLGETTRRMRNVTARRIIEQIESLNAKLNALIDQNK